MIKDLLVDNIDGHVIYFSEEATKIAKQVNTKQDKLDKSKLVVGMHVFLLRLEIIAIMVYVIWVLA